MKKVIFVGGIHGVGKGTLCRSLATKFDIPHFSASELLKWSEISIEVNKVVEDFDLTQKRLLVGIENILPDNKLSLVDGHFCLFNISGHFDRIPQAVFVRISPCFICVLTADVKIIRSRLTARDKKTYSLKLLTDMQKEEISYAKEIASSLNIGFAEINDLNYSALINVIADTK